MNRFMRFDTVGACIAFALLAAGCQTTDTYTGETKVSNTA